MIEIFKSFIFILFAWVIFYWIIPYGMYLTLKHKKYGKGINYASRCLFEKS